MERYYTVDQIAKLLAMHPKTIQRYIREGKLPAKKVGKSWRITGHDLSVFTENYNEFVNTAAEQPMSKVVVSSVIDIQVSDIDESIRIINMLVAVLNSKSPEYGRSSMHTQFIDYIKSVRVTLWGTLPFVQKMFEMISIITEQPADPEIGV